MPDRPAPTIRTSTCSMDMRSEGPPKRAWYRRIPAASQAGYRACGMVLAPTGTGRYLASLARRGVRDDGRADACEPEHVRFRRDGRIDGDLDGPHARERG